MFSLWMFGRIVEQTMKPSRFLLFYFVCGIGAAVCQEVWQLADYYFSGMSAFAGVSFPDGTTMPMGLYLNQWTTIGASGACYGILLAFGMTFPNERIMLLIPPFPSRQNTSWWDMPPSNFSRPTRQTITSLISPIWVACSSVCCSFSIGATATVAATAPLAAGKRGRRAAHAVFRPHKRRLAQTDGA